MLHGTDSRDPYRFCFTDSAPQPPRPNIAINVDTCAGDEIAAVQRAKASPAYQYAAPTAGKPNQVGQAVLNFAQLLRDEAPVALDIMPTTRPAMRPEHDAAAAMLVNRFSQAKTASAEGAAARDVADHRTPAQLAKLRAQLLGIISETRFSSASARDRVVVHLASEVADLPPDVRLPVMRSLLAQSKNVSRRAQAQVGEALAELLITGNSQEKRVVFSELLDFTRHMAQTSDDVACGRVKLPDGTDGFARELIFHRLDAYFQALPAEERLNALCTLMKETTRLSGERADPFFESAKQHMHVLASDTDRLVANMTWRELKRVRSEKPQRASIAALFCSPASGCAPVKNYVMETILQN